MDTPEGKKAIAVFINADYIRELRVYAVQTNVTLQKLIRPLVVDFEQGILKMLHDIREQKRQSEEGYAQNQVIEEPQIEQIAEQSAF